MASKQPLTPWFPHHIKPVRRGVYRVRNMINATGYAYWDGSRWGWLEGSQACADKLRDTVGASQDKGWRGLSKESK
jgi:hypothetical protein